REQAHKGPGGHDRQITWCVVQPPEAAARTLDQEVSARLKRRPERSRSIEGDPDMIRRHPIIWQSSSLLVLVSVLSGCNSSLPVADTPPPPVSVSQPVVRDVVDYDDYEGYIAADRGNNLGVHEVRARVRGHLVKVNFQDGQMTKEGDLLFEI